MLTGREGFWLGEGNHCRATSAKDICSPASYAVWHRRGRRGGRIARRSCSCGEPGVCEVRTSGDAGRGCSSLIRNPCGNWLIFHQTPRGSCRASGSSNDWMAVNRAVAGNEFYYDDEPRPLDAGAEPDSIGAFPRRATASAYSIGTYDEAICQFAAITL